MTKKRLFWIAVTLALVFGLPFAFGHGYISIILLVLVLFIALAALGARMGEKKDNGRTVSRAELAHIVGRDNAVLRGGNRADHND